MLHGKFRELVSPLSRWSSASTNRKIFQAMLTVGTATIALRAIGMAKEMVIAAYFGVGASVDAFMIAMILPTVALNSVIRAFPLAMVPVYVQERSKVGRAAASRLYGSVASFAIPLFVASCAIIYLIGPPLISIIGSELSEDTLDLTRKLLYWVAPVVIITGMRLLISSIVNAEERFGLAAIVPSFTAVSIIVSIVFFEDQIGAYTLALGTLIGAGLELILLVALCKRHQIGIMPRWYGFSSGLQSVLREFGPLAFGSMLLASTIIVDQAMAATLGPGNVSSLGFGNRITAVFVGLGTAVVATSIFPYFSVMVVERHWKEVRHTLNTYARLLAYVTLPVTGLLLVFSNEIISIIFERGKFSAEDTRLVGTVQFYYALQIPFHVIAILAVRLISALQMNKILMWGTMISLTLNIILNLVFMKLMGVAGIALSTACVHLVSFTYLWTMLYRALPRDKGLSEPQCAKVQE